MLEAALSFPEIDVNIPDNEGNTPLHFAAQAGKHILIKKLFPIIFFPVFTFNFRKGNYYHQYENEKLSFM